MKYTIEVDADGYLTMHGVFDDAGTAAEVAAKEFAEFEYDILAILPVKTRLSNESRSTEGIN